MFTPTAWLLTSGPSPARKLGVEFQCNNFISQHPAQCDVKSQLWRGSGGSGAANQINVIEHASRFMRLQGWIYWPVWGGALLWEASSISTSVMMESVGFGGGSQLLSDIVTQWWSGVSSLLCSLLLLSAHHWLDCLLLHYTEMIASQSSIIVWVVLCSQALRWYNQCVIHWSKYLMWY